MSIGVKKNHFILLLISDLRRDYDNMDYFFQLFKWFQLFSEFVFSWKMQDMVRTSQKWTFWKGVVEGFNYFIFLPESSMW
jgi:hypothetical protein